MASTIDMTKTYGELAAEVPELEGVMTELGFESLDADKTIPQIADEAGVAVSIVAMGLEASGITVEGYEPEDDHGAGKVLDDVFGVLFNNEVDGEKLPDDASLSPMFTHMEMAIRRAQKNGTLPKNADAQSDAAESDAAQDDGKQE